MYMTGLHSRVRDIRAPSQLPANSNLRRENRCCCQGPVGGGTGSSVPLVAHSGRPANTSG